MSATVVATAPDPAAVSALREAATWQLLARLFECPSSAWHDDLRALDRDLGDAGLHAVVDAALTEASEGLYHSVFGPGGPAPPREVSYHDGLELGSVMSAVTGYYGAFAYRPDTAEPPDHVAVEVGFMAWLRTKQAFALVAGDAERAELCADAAEGFRADHLALVAERLSRVLDSAPASYLAMAGHVLRTRVGAPPGPRRLPVIQPFDDDGSEFSCEAGG
jgi:nitrate reductase assembly molybdenum cofactor insertion protein NarJ